MNFIKIILACTLIITYSLHTMTPNLPNQEGGPTIAQNAIEGNPATQHGQVQFAQLLSKGSESESARSKKSALSSEIESYGSMQPNTVEASTQTNEHKRQELERLLKEYYKRNYSPLYASLYKDKEPDEVCCPKCIECCALCFGESSECTRWADCFCGLD